MRVGRESVGLDPTASTGQLIALHEIISDNRNLREISALPRWSFKGNAFLSSDPDTARESLCPRPQVT
jgi:hypothetical protein